MKTAVNQPEHVDCIALKRKIQRQISAETKGMTLAQRLAHFRKLADESPFATLLKRRTDEANRR